MKQNEIFLDIETIPNTAMEKFLPKPEARGNLKDPEKIKADIEEKQKKQRESMALSPLYGRVAVIGVAHCGKVEQPHLDFACFRDVDLLEKELIEYFFSFMDSVDNPTLVTYNGKHFDVPFIYKRAMILGVDLREFKTVFPLAMYTNRYTTSPHCDIALVLAEEWNRTIKLDTVSMAILNQKKHDFDVTTIAERLRNGDTETVLSYNFQDLKLLEDLYSKAKNILF